MKAMAAGFGLKTKYNAPLAGIARPSGAYDLAALARHLETAPYDLRGAAAQGRQDYSFPVAAAGGLLVVDEKLGLPISLTSALQTAAVYQRMDWDEKLSRRYAAIEFFDSFCQKLLVPALRLAVTRQLALDLNLSNLIVRVSRGEPVSVQVRQLKGTVGPIFPQPSQPSAFAPTPATPDFYRRFLENLLTTNLRPLISRLAEISGAKPLVFWDYTIEAALHAFENMPVESDRKEEARLALLMEELNPGGQIRQPRYTPSPNSRLAFSQPLYIKRQCCEKFKRKTRCDNCPGLMKK